MAVPDDTNLINLINSNIPDAGPGRQRTATASFVRAVLIALVNWVKAGMANTISTWQRVGDNQPGGSQAETIYHTGKVIVGRTYDDGAGYSLQADTANFGMINGMPAAPPLALATPADGLAGRRYYLFAELPAPTGGTYDFIHFTLVAKPWDNPQGNHLILTMYAANRGGFRAYHQFTGDQDQVGIIAMTQPDGRTLLYVSSDNGFRAISVKVHQHGQARLYTSFQPANELAGTVAYDTLNFGVYKPLMALKSRFTAFSVGNSDSAYPSAINEPGTGLLSFVANWLAGFSDLGLVNSNVAGKGFTFWQLTSTQTKQLLAYLTEQGFLGLGTVYATARLHTKNDAAPYKQLRLENYYTPTGKNDPNGEIGSIVWDNNNISVKTGNGWAKAPLTYYN